MSIKKVPLPKVSREWEARTTVIDSCDIRPGRPVAIGPMTDRLNLVVHTLYGPVGDPDTGPGQYPVEMRPEHPGQRLEGRQPAMAGAPEPLAQAWRGLKEGLSPRARGGVSCRPRAEHNSGK